MELYYNLFLRLPSYSYGAKPNPIFNFKDIGKLTPVVDNIIPFVLMKDGVIKVKEKYKQEWNNLIKSDRILKKCELEVELKVCALWAIELLLNHRKSLDDNYKINATQYQKWRIRNNMYKHYLMKMHNLHNLYTSTK